MHPLPRLKHLNNMDFDPFAQLLRDIQGDKNKMDAVFLFSIVLIFMAAILIGSILLTRSVRESRTEFMVDTEQQMSGMGNFKDCFDLCASDSKQACSTLCTTQASM
jgi:hypothetical protein